MGKNVKGHECVAKDNDYWGLKAILDNASPASEEWQGALRESLEICKSNTPEAAAMRKAIEARTGCRVSVADSLPARPAEPAPTKFHDNVIKLVRR